MFNIKVIIFNKTMGTGVNILDKEHEFDTFITYSTKHEFLNDDDIYQARMRIRHDIEREYRYTKAHDIKKADKDNMKQVEVIEQYLDRDLSTSDMKQIISDCKWSNGKNPLSVNKAIAKLESLGYTVDIEVIRKVKHFRIGK